jgi:hypothetical protein
MYCLVFRTPWTALYQVPGISYIVHCKFSQDSGSVGKTEKHYGLSSEGTNVFGTKLAQVSTGNLEGPHKSFVGNFLGLVFSPLPVFNLIRQKYRVSSTASVKPGLGLHCSNVES